MIRRNKTLYQIETCTINIPDRLRSRTFSSNRSLRLILTFCLVILCNDFKLQNLQHETKTIFPQTIERDILLGDIFNFCSAMNVHLHKMELVVEARSWAADILFRNFSKRDIVLSSKRVASLLTPSSRHLVLRFFCDGKIMNFANLQFELLLVSS